MIHIRFVITKTSTFLIWGIILLFAYVAFSCEEFCEEPNRTAIVVNFYSSESDAPESASVRITGIGVKNGAGIENDSVLYSQTSYSQVLLPVNPGSDEMSFSFELGELPADTIIFRYSRHAGFISAECGCASFAEIYDAQLKGTEQEHTITHLEVTNPSVKTVTYRQGIINEENIRIYY